MIKHGKARLDSAGRGRARLGSARQGMARHGKGSPLYFLRGDSLIQKGG